MAINLTTKHKKTLAYFLMLFASINFVFQYYSYQNLKTNTFRNGEEFATKNSDAIAKGINILLKKIEFETNKTIKEMVEIDDYSELNISNLCKDRTTKIPELLGVTISFEPYIYSKKDSLFSVYFDKNQGKCMRIDTIYNYTDTNLPSAKWYTDVIKFKKGYWTKPYYGNGAKNLITDYSAPIIKQNKIIGVVTYTLSINNLMHIMHEFSLGKSGFGFLVNNHGMVITHPNPDYILKQNMYEMLNNDPILDKVFGENKGFIPEYTNPKGASISIGHQLLSNNEWKLITIFSPIDLFENNTEIKSKLVNLFISGSIVLIILLFLIIIPKGISTKEAWIYSFSITFVLIFNIGFVWYLNLNNKYESHAKEDVIIKGKTSLNSFISNENSKRRHFGLDKIVEVPTGIIVEKMKFIDSYNIGISGWIWQKYPKDCKIEPKIYFPQLSPFAEADYLELFSKEDKKGYTLIKWKFRSTFIFNFKYVKYPFNTKTVKLKITHPDFTNNVLFTPDITAYETLNPSALPGISSDSKTSSSSYISSNFTFGKLQFPGNFDSNLLSELKEIPILQFEVKTRKPFLNALIKQFIPITLVSLMIYLLLFNLRTNKTTGHQTVGIETVAGFLFILVLSHIDFRKTVFSGSITYLESFYFVIYLMIAFISVNIVLFNLSKEYFMNRNSNKLLKLAYWPFFFLTIYLITLGVFY